MATAYEMSWAQPKRWTIRESSVPDMEPEDILVFEGDGTVENKANNKLQNVTRNFCWCSDFVHNGDDSVSGKTTFQANYSIKRSIKEPGSDPPDSPKFKLTGTMGSGGGSWIADEGG